MRPRSLRWTAAPASHVTTAESLSRPWYAVLTVALPSQGTRTTMIQTGLPGRDTKDE